MDSLEYLFSSYFHQDWKLEHSTWEGVIDEFLTDSPQRVSAVPGEIDRLLDDADEGSLERAIAQLGAYYLPDSGAHAHRDWLLAVRDRIQAALDSTS